MKALGIYLLLMLSLSSTAFAAKEWEEAKGRYFIVYHRNVPQHYVDTVLEEAESNFQRVADNLGIRQYQSWAWDNRAEIYIYADHDDYVKNGGMGWSHGMAIAGSKIIRTFPSDAGFFDSILPHELGHIILHELVGKVADVPLWFDEGVAQYQEKARRLSAHHEVREAIKNGQFIPLTDLSVMRLYNDTLEETVQLYYAESASVVSFLFTEHGDQRFRRFCEMLGEHRSFEQALAAVYSRIQSIDDLNKAWKKFLEEE
jgi:hypothetical protein